VSLLLLLLIPLPQPPLLPLLCLLPQIVQA
jgi:hypothetical protein